MTLQIRTFARRFKSRPQAVGLAGSMLVHVGLAGFLLQPAASAYLTPRRDPASSAERGAVAISLLRQAPLVAPAVTASPQHDAAAPHEAAPDSLAATSPNLHPATAVLAQPATAAQPPMASTAPPASAAASATEGASADTALANATLASDYQRRLRAHIRSFEQDGAGWGVTELTFEIDRQGRLHGIWVTKSSGSAVLDQVAIATVRRAEPMPPIPSGLPDEVTVQLPYEFTRSS